MKSEGVKGVVSAKRARSKFGMYEDCGEYYHQNEAVAKAVLDELVRVKISTEKYAKKLKHEENGR